MRFQGSKIAKSHVLKKYGNARPISVFVVHVVLIVAVLYEKLLEIISKFQKTNATCVVENCVNVGTKIMKAYRYEVLLTWPR